MVVVGQLLVYSLGIWLKYYVVALIAGGIAAIHTVAILFIPETPRWLLANGKETLAVDALHRLHGRDANIMAEKNALIQAVASEEKSSFFKKLLEFKKRSVIWLLVLILGLMFFQQFCGINIVAFYGSKLVGSTQDPNSLYYASFGIGFINLIVTGVGVALMDLAGRRKLLAVGGVVMFLSTVYLGAYYLACHKLPRLSHPSNKFHYTALAALGVYLIGFNLGWGAIPWVMMGELAPLKVRGIMGGIATAANWSFATIVTMFFEDYEDRVHFYGLWWSFAFVTFLSIFFVLIFLPETKGKTLEEIQDMYVLRFDKKSKE